MIAYGSITISDLSEPFSVIISNDSIHIPTNSSRITSDAQTYTSNIIVYQGTTQRTDFAIGSVQAPNFFTITKQSSSVQLAIKSGTSISSDNGTIIISISLEGSTINKTISWSCTKEGIPAKSVDIVSNGLVFKSSDGGENFLPNIVRLTPIFQGGLLFNKWQYSIDNGATWKDVADGKYGLKVSDSIGNLAVSNKTISVYTDYIVTDSTLNITEGGAVSDTKLHLKSRSATSTHSLLIAKDCALFNNSITSIVFKCISNDTNYYDTATVLRLHDVNDIEFGGVNLLTNTASIKQHTAALCNWTIESKNNVAKNVLDAATDSQRIVTSNATNPDSGFYSVISGIQFKRKQHYVYSLAIRGTINQSTIFGMEIFYKNTSGKIVSSSSTSWINDGDGVNDGISQFYFSRRYLPFVIPTDFDETSNYLAVCLYAPNMDIQIRNFQLEKGLNPSPWRHADGDVVSTDASIATIATVESIVDKVNGEISNKISRTDTIDYTDENGKNVSSTISNFFSESTQNLYGFIWKVFNTNSGSTELSLTDGMIQAITNQFVIKDSSGKSVIIEKGNIKAHAITSMELATDAIKSLNYVADNNFSKTGTFIDLSNGTICTPSFYMDNDGQFVFGDASQYVKFYKISEGKYKLAIAVEDLFIGSSNVADTIEDAKKTADNAASVASSAKSTAESASSAASTATSTANAAKSTADSASKTASDAASTASAANQTASSAKTTADNASKVATEAKSTASNASSVAGTAKTTADNANKAASEAKSTASTAKSTADQAKSAADTANNNVSALTKRVTEAETSISKNKDEIELRAKKTEVTEAIDNIDIGGRNLLKDTHSSDRTYTYPSSNYQDYFYQCTTIPLNGDTYTLSFWAKSTVAGDVIRVHFYDPSNIISVKGSQGQVSSARDGRCDFTLSTTLTKYWVVYTIPKGGNSYRSVIIPRMGPGADVYGTGTITVKWEKLEEGNKPTDWSPAPEDYYTKTETDASIKVLSDKITQQVSTTDDLGKRMSKVEQDSGSWSVTLETANAAKSAADNASQTASSAKSAADSANKNASNAVSTANNAQKTAENAVSTASSASSTATEAKSTADQANQTASTANSTASAAKSTAENATSTANAAKSAADKANTAADTARTEAAAAAKTATNYMNFDGSGLTVGNLTEKTLGRNVNIDNSSVKIRNGNNVLAQFAEGLIEIGKNTSVSAVSFMNGTVELIAQMETWNNIAFRNAYLLAQNTICIGAGSTDPTSDKLASMLTVRKDRINEINADVTDTEGHAYMNVRGGKASVYSDGNAGWSSVNVIANKDTSQVELHTNGSNGYKKLINYSHGLYYYDNSTILAAYNGQTPCLWDGYVWMRAGQTAALSAPISQQPHGIIVIFALYNPTTGGVTNVMTNPYFVPKTAINYDYVFTMFWESGWKAGVKRVSVQDTQIVGNAQNDAATFKASSGITLDERWFVLRRVYGV